MEAPAKTKQGWPYEYQSKLQSKENHKLETEESIHQEDIIILNA